MKRRDFLKAVTTGIVVGGIVPTKVMAKILIICHNSAGPSGDEHIKNYLHKMQTFDQPHKGDVYLDQRSLLLLKSSVKRFKRLQRTVGYGNFHLLSFDDALKIARNYSRVGAFHKDEIVFLEKLFYQDSATYGFLGKKPVKNLTDRIPRHKVVRIPRTGNYLYKGLPLETYRKIKQEIGDQAILTSGIRSVIKQFLLFLDKAYKNQGNLSLASRQLAPPGYSYHGISDFDVGQVGYGAINFTARFVETDVFKKLTDLGYLKLRYPEGNLLGVRFEPWHIKV
jgi:D-alanyl-D-alanine carboxypeptidase